MDCHDFLQSLAHAVRFVAMTVKNDFSILNLVESFLTSIKFNFDSLHKENKNPCLVINKKYIKYQGEKR